MRRWLITVLGTAVVCLFMWLTAPKEEVQNVKTVTPNLSDIVYSVSAGGTIEQIQASSLFSSDYATVETIYINPGDRVKKGQVLMILNPTGTKIPDDTDMADMLTEVFSQVMDEKVSGPSYSNGTEIVSPIDGIITELGVKEMETVTPVTKCVVVSDISRMQAIVNVAESDIFKIKKGMPAGITGEAFRGTYNGVVLEISRQIKSEVSISGEGEKYAEVVIELYDADKNLLPGSSVQAKIYTSKKEEVLTLPYEAITQDFSNKEVVYIVKDGVIYKRNIITGYELSSLVEIKSGLSRDDEVILSPSDDLNEGQKVVVIN